MVRKLQRFSLITLTFLILMAGILILPKLGLAEDLSHTISGTITLTDGVVAPAEGLNGKIYLIPQNGGNNYSTDFSISAGGRSASYTVTVPGDALMTGYRVSYGLDQSYPGYVGNGYYSTGGTTNYNSATLIHLNGGNIDGVNLTIFTGNTVSGTVSLPSDETAPAGGIRGYVLLDHQNGGSYYSTEFTIPEGDHSGTYSITVPVNLSDPEYRVRYSLNYNGFVGEGYYSEGGTTNATSATLLNVNNGAVTGINLSLLRGHTISGTITLPGDRTAPAGGITGQVYIAPQNGGYSYYAEFNIVAGGKSATYTTMVPIDSSISEYLVRYSLNTLDSGYAAEGYYSTGGTTNATSATLVNIGGGNATGIDLTLLTGKAISGTITLPGDMTAPSGGISGQVYIYPQNGGDRYHVGFDIPFGGSSASYSATIPVDTSTTDYKVSYYLYDNFSGYVSEGYYSTTGTTNSNSATLVNLSGGNATEIDLTLLTGTTISGTITLPVGETAPLGGIRGEVYVDPRNGANPYTEEFTIPTGGRSTSYTVTVPNDATVTEYQVRYNLYFSYSGYNGDGYYSDDGTTNYYAATLVNVSEGNQAGIDLTLLKSTPDDYGNTSATATEISIGTNITGRIDPAGDIDYFKFTPDHTGNYSFTTLSGCDTYGYLFDADQTLLADNDDAGEDLNFLITWDLQAHQDYYLKVKLLSSAETGSYQLSVTETSPPIVAVTSLTLDQSNVTLDKDQTEQLTATILPDNATDKTVTWSVSSTSGSTIATVSDTGLVTAKNEGTAVIRATSNADSSMYAEANVTVVNDTIISGTITLPGTMTAPVGGIEGYLYFYPQNGGSSKSILFNIPEGSRSASYTANLPQDTSITGYRVYYSLDYTGYADSGYYSTAGTTTNYSSATIVDVSGGNASEINLTLLTCTIISGTITLPGTMTAPAVGVYGTVYIEPQDGGNNYSTSFNIPAGKSSISYSTTIPEGTPTGYRVRYSLYSDSDYLREGYYSTNGTTNLNSATWINLNQGNRTDINLTILMGRTISGTFSLPGAETAPAGWLEGQIYIAPENGTKSYYAFFHLPEGESSASYSVHVPVDASIAGYRVSYSLYSNSGNYVRTGYYSTTGTTSLKNATLVSVQDGNALNINLTPFKGHTISGTISLPNGELAPGLQGLIYVSLPKDSDPSGGTSTGDGGGTVGANQENGSIKYTGSFTILPGKNFANYTTEAIPFDETILGYTVNYNLYNNPQYVGEGYYSSTAGTTTSKGATLVNVNAGDVTNINLTLLTGHTISGTISLPNNATVTDKGISGTVYVDPQNGDNRYFGNFYIPVGASSADYSVRVPSDTSISGYRVNYSLYDNYGYVGAGYYSTASGIPTTTTSKAATLVNAETSNATNINLTLLTGNTISGTVSLPEGATTPVNGMELSVNLDPLDGGNSYTTSFYMAGGRTSASYTATVPVDTSMTGYRVNYVLRNNYAGYLNEGYYSPTGTTTSSSAILVDVRAGNVANIDMILLTASTTPSTTPSAISLNKATATLMIGQTEQLIATITPDDVADKSVTWSVSIPYESNVTSTSGSAIDIATVSETGLVTAVNIGTAVIRATSNADATQQAECLVTVTTGSALVLSATPVVEIGVNPGAGDIAGMFIGLENIIDSTTNSAIQTNTIAGYQIEVTFDPNLVSIPEVLDATDSGDLFSSNVEIADGIGTVKVACASGGSIEHYNQLFFIPITLKGSAREVTGISVKFLEVRDINLHTIHISALEDLKFQRGKIYNGETGNPNIADAVAGLQYLAKLKNPGLGSNEVNPVNMASINESAVNSTGAKANVKDIIALLQYSVDLRDEQFNLKLP